nr:MAG: capsid protein [Wufeng shrew picorna-like virus 20]
MNNQTMTHIQTQTFTNSKYKGLGSGPSGPSTSSQADKQSKPTLSDAEWSDLSNYLSPLVGKGNPYVNSLHAIASRTAAGTTSTVAPTPKLEPLNSETAELASNPYLQFLGPEEADRRALLTDTNHFSADTESAVAANATPVAAATTTTASLGSELFGSMTPSGAIGSALGVGGSVANAIVSTMFGPSSTIHAGGSSGVNPGVSDRLIDMKEEDHRYEDEAQAYALWSHEPNSIELGKSPGVWTLPPHVQFSIDRSLSTFRKLTGTSLNNDAAGTKIKLFRFKHDSVMKYFGASDGVFSLRTPNLTASGSTNYEVTINLDQINAMLLRKSRYRIQLLFYCPVTMMERVTLSLMSIPPMSVPLLTDSDDFSDGDSFRGAPILPHARMDFHLNNWQLVTLPSWATDFAPPFAGKYHTQWLDNELGLYSLYALHDSLLSNIGRTLEIYFRVVDVQNTQAYSVNPEIVVETLNPFAVVTSNVTAESGNNTVSLDRKELTKPGQLLPDAIELKRLFGLAIASHNHFHKTSKLGARDLLYSWKYFAKITNPGLVENSSFQFWPLFPGAFASSNAVATVRANVFTPLAEMAMYYGYWSGGFDVKIQSTLNTTSSGKIQFWYDTDCDGSHLALNDQTPGIYSAVLDMSKGVEVTMECPQKGDRMLKYTAGHDFNQYGYTYSTSNNRVNFFSPDNVIVNDGRLAAKKYNAPTSAFMNGWINIKPLTNFVFTNQGTGVALQFILSVKPRPDFRFYVPIPRMKMPVVGITAESGSNVVEWQHQCVEDPYEEILHRPVMFDLPLGIVGPATLAIFYDEFPHFMLSRYARFFRGGIWLHGGLSVTPGTAGRLKIQVYDVLHDNGSVSTNPNSQMNGYTLSVTTTAPSTQQCGTRSVGADRLLGTYHVDVAKTPAFKFHVPFSFQDDAGQHHMMSTDDMVTRGILIVVSPEVVVNMISGVGAASPNLTILAYPDEDTAYFEVRNATQTSGQNGYRRDGGTLTAIV